jgi:CTP:molybdopterin cytidylyltransferase MocA
MTDRLPVAGVILAAGRGRRFGGPKAQALLRGRTLLDRVVSVAATSGLEPVIVVVPPGTVPPAGATAVANPLPERGLSSSLQLGIVAVPPGHAALVLLVDQPTVEQSTVATVLARRGHRPLVAAWADGRAGPPVLIEPDAFPLVMALSGDIGLREVLASRPELVEAASVPSHPPTVETPDDLARLEAEAGDRLAP